MARRRNENWLNGCDIHCCCQNSLKKLILFSVEHEIKCVRASYLLHVILSISLAMKHGLLTHTVPSFLPVARQPCEAVLFDSLVRIHIFQQKKRDLAAALQPLVFTNYQCLSLATLLKLMVVGGCAFLLCGIANCVYR